MSNSDIDEKRRHFEDIHMKVKLEDQLKVQKEESNNNNGKIEQEIQEAIALKLSEKCGDLIQTINKLSSDGKMHLDSNYRIEMTPIKGKEKDFLKTKINLEDCAKKIDNVQLDFIERIKYLTDYRIKTHENCLNKCFDKNSDDVTELCIKDCYDLLFINTKASHPIVKDELLKYLSTIRKI
jgi:hypothetical protein